VWTTPALLVERVSHLKHRVTMVQINAVLASSVRDRTTVVSVNLKRQTNVEPETLGGSNGWLGFNVTARTKVLLV
jgi:hypothetical protein